MSMSNVNENNLVAVTDTLITEVDAQDIILNRLFFDNISYETAVGFMVRNEEKYQHYSTLECRQMAEAISDSICDWCEHHHRLTGRRVLNVFSALGMTADELLKKEDEVVCKYNKLISWRAVARAIGEDLPVAAMYAQMDIVEGRATRSDFRWESVIGHNNRQLNALVERGVSEHHAHLFASLPYFSVSWVNLMNTISDNAYENHLCRIERQNQVPLKQSYIDALVQNGGMMPHREELFVIHRLQAAVIRFYLCMRLSGHAPTERTDKSIRLYTYSGVQTLLWNKEELLLAERELQEEIVGWGGSQTQDYVLSLFAFSPLDGDDVQNSFLGERWLLYCVLRDIYADPQNRRLSREEHNLFYAYVCLKNELREQMVQVNDRVGFDNFQTYEQRKGFFFQPTLQAEQQSAQLAVREPLRKKAYIKEMEVRISPAKSLQENYLRITQLDEAICGLIGNSIPWSDTPQEDLRDRYYYVIHFIKRPDRETESLQAADLIRENINQGQECRHYRLRESLRQQTDVLITLREKYPATAGRVHGIDAASQEIGCRPEVFAATFRELGNRTEDDLWLLDEKLPRLHKTYHAGEDFLDVVDGLRAIDEAVRFLDLDCGDRMGHAIALGIDAKEWYKGKQYQVSLTVHDYLDNLAWMYHALRHYKVEKYTVLKEYLQEQFDYFFREVYLIHLDQEQLNQIMKKAEEHYSKKMAARGYRSHPCKFDIEVYYKAWCLRGDEPELYKNGFYAPEEIPIDNRDYYYTNWRFPQNFEQRYIPECAILYYSYHYNAEIKAAGHRRITVPIRRDYADACAEIQKCMRTWIAARGIAIETNPSSNVLISTFREYDKHPLYRFYNKHLASGKELEECAQLNVSINTDDNGVFFTSLENEYALMARATEQVSDENGTPKYKKADIYDWLDEIRKMGNEQGF